MVHRRLIDGNPVAFGHQGSIWQEAQAIFDHKTGSVWSQPYGAAFMGELAGYELELLPFTMTTWESWTAQYPETLAYAEPMSLQEEALDESSIVVEGPGETVAYPLNLLAEHGAVNDTIGLEDPIDVAIVLGDSADLAWRVYLTRLGSGEVMELRAGDSPEEIVDTVTGTVFHALYGYGIDGPLADHHLVAVPASTIFTEQFLDYHPDGRVWAP